MFKDIIYKLRVWHGLSQGELADTVHVSRQAVSKWETGISIPDAETLLLLSKIFDVSIDDMLENTRKCDGKETEAVKSAHYSFKPYIGTYDKNHTYPPLECGVPMTGQWKRIEDKLYDNYLNELKNHLIKEINELIQNTIKIYDIPHIDDLYLLIGKWNVPCYAVSQQTALKVDIETLFFGNQFKYDDNKYLGILANEDYIIAAEYDDSKPTSTLLAYKLRKNKKGELL